jgi:dTDP-4-dehydrorhamnose 3,5-epimerase
MIFSEIALQGAYLLELEPAVDQRGSFARVFDRHLFIERGLIGDFVQNSISENQRGATLRGMHYQAAPAAEAKLVQCIRGALFDVIIDLRPESATYCRWFGVELSAANRRLLYVPKGFAHGFQTLLDDTAVYYMISEAYAPQYARGVRWNDPAFGIKWPFAEPIIAEKDRLLPDYKR